MNQRLRELQQSPRSPLYVEQPLRQLELPLPLIQNESCQVLANLTFDAILCLSSSSQENQMKRIFFFKPKTYITSVQFFQLFPMNLIRQKQTLGCNQERGCITDHEY